MDKRCVDIDDVLDLFGIEDEDLYATGTIEDALYNGTLKVYKLPSTKRRGRWILNDNGTYSCSLCQSWIPNEQHYYARYCLYCGAKMDGDDSQLPINENRSLCKLRHKNGNCLCVGGFCTAVNDEICKAVRMSYEKGYIDGKMDEEEATSNATPHTECVVNLYTETKLRFVLDECIEDEELIEKILKMLDGDVE